jgi:retinol dehydrogenase-12
MDYTAWFRSQYVKLPVPVTRFTGQTVIVTGSNVGLGLETARHFVGLDASKVILAVRSISKGEAAAKSIEESTGRTGVVDVWHLDHASYASIEAFAKKAQSLDRLDVVVINAGIVMYEFELAEDNESNITVNAVSGIILGILLLPKLRETSIRYKKETVLPYTSSFTHFMTEFPERKSDFILKELANKDRARMQDR